MTTQDPESGDSRRDQVIAGEYVLGVLSADDRRKVEARLVLDRAFAAMVKHWESNLSTFDESYEPLPPSPQCRSPQSSPRYDSSSRALIDPLWER